SRPERTATSRPVGSSRFPPTGCTTGGTSTCDRDSGACTAPEWSTGTTSHPMGAAPQTCDSTRRRAHTPYPIGEGVFLCLLSGTAQNQRRTPRDTSPRDDLGNGLNVSQNRFQRLRETFSADRSLTCAQASHCCESM